MKGSISLNTTFICNRSSPLTLQWQSSGLRRTGCESCDQVSRRFLSTFCSKNTYEFRKLENVLTTGCGRGIRLDQQIRPVKGGMEGLLRRKRSISQAVLVESAQNFLRFKDSVCLQSDTEFVVYGERGKGKRSFWPVGETEPFCSSLRLNMALL